MARLKVTLDIFSGRPNPSFEIGAKEGRELLAALGNTRRLERGEPGVPPEPTLGYRGLVVEQLDKPVRGLPRQLRVVHGHVFGGRAPLALRDDVIEARLLAKDRLQGLQLGRAFPGYVRQELERYRELRWRFPWRPHKWPTRYSCACAPLWEPAWWNDGGQRELHNNCYNYASDYRTDRFRLIAGGSQPGAAAGAMYTSITGPAVRSAAIADGVIAAPRAGNKCPKEGHLVALVIAPGYDFHWYRKGRNGSWTHKPGSTPATNVDNSGNLIADPRTADRGSYTQFTTFMVVMHGHVKIA